MLLKLADLEYEADTSGFRRAPKGKQPYIYDDGETIADSTFIRFHIEKKYGFDFYAGLDEKSKAIAWAAEKLCEDNLYWVVVSDRWGIKKNFDRGPANFFDEAPSLIKPFIVRTVRHGVIDSTKAQGMGRHSEEEMHKLAEHGIEALAGMLGDNKYFMGDHVTGADATIFAFIDTMACDLFDTPVKYMITDRDNLNDYRMRMRAEYFPELDD